MDKLNSNSLKQHIAVNAGYSIFGAGTQKAIRYFVAFVLTNMLGVSLYGEYSLGMSILDIAKIFSILGLNYGAIRYISYYMGKKNPEGIKGALRFFILTVGGLSFLIAIVFFALAPTIASGVYGKPEITDVLKILAFALPPMSIVLLMSAVFRGFQQLKYSVYLSDIVLPTLSVIFFSAAWLLGKSLETVLYFVVFINFVGVLLSAYFLVKIFPQLTGSSLASQSNNKEIFLYSLPLFISVFLNIFLNRTDVLMLGYFGSMADVGVYSLSAKLAQVVFIVSASVFGIFAPVSSELFARDDRSRLKKMFVQATRFAAIVSAPIFGALILARTAVLAVFGEGFGRGDEVLLILGLALLINSILGFAGQMLSMSGRSKLVLLNSLGGAGLNIVLNWIFIPKWGMAGAAWATMIATLSVNVARVTEVLILEKMHAFSFSLLKPLIITAVLLFGVLNLSLPINSTVFDNLISAILFGALYVIFAYFLILTEDDKEIMKTLMSRVTK